MAFALKLAEISERYVSMSLGKRLRDVWLINRLSTMIQDGKHSKTCARMCNDIIRSLHEA